MDAGIFRFLQSFAGFLTKKKDRSQAIKNIFKKCQKMKGPMGPMGLGPKTQNFTKIIRSHENLVLWQNETDARRNSSKV